jgi:hypothetical protein
MEKEKLSNSECYTALSEPFGIEKYMLFGFTSGPQSNA